ncbi:hypothetical protein [Streptomyces capoamus]
MDILRGNSVRVLGPASGRAPVLSPGPGRDQNATAAAGALTTVPGDLV